MSTAQFLPSGVECRFDPKSGKHYYVKQGQQGIQPTTATTLSWDEPSNQYGSKVRTSSPSEFTSIPLQDMTNRSLDKVSVIQVDENLCKKLAALFPSVQEDDLRILCKRSFNNEMLAMSDLTAKGFRPISNVGAYRSSSTYNSTSSPQCRNSTTPTPPPAATSNYSKLISTSTSGGVSTTTAGLTTTSGGGGGDNYWSSTAPPHWMNAIRRTNSPLPNRLMTTTSSASSSGSGSPVPTLQRPCYYPGRFVQGVGFEPSSMGGSPHAMTGKPFAPLQGRYALSGMITEKSASPRVHRIQTIARDPNYGHMGSRVLSQSLAYPNMGVGVSGGAGPGVSASQYSYTVSHAMPPPPPPPTSAIRSSYAYGHSGGGGGPPIPSWYGEEDRQQFVGSPQPSSPRLYAVVHDAFVKNRVTDRSASPPVLPPATRTASYAAGHERMSTPPTAYHYQYHQLHQQQQQPTMSYQTNQPNFGGGSFYATASRLYSQSPKAARRANMSAGSYGVGGEFSSTTPSPSPHYQVPPRTAQYIAPSPMYAQHQQAYSSNRTYSPQTVQHHPFQPPTMLERMQIGHEAAFAPIRSSPGPHSPKIKLRYLRRIYPGVDETVLLDILANADNNVQTAMTDLNQMGYVKVDTPPVRPASAAHQLTPSKVGEGPRSPRPGPQQLQERPVAPPRRLTEADKQKTRARMLEKVKEIPAAILTIALESVDFDEDRALLLLSNMRADDKTLNGFQGGMSSIDGQFEDGALSAEALQNKLSGLSKGPVAPVRRSQLDDKKDVVMLSKGTWTQEDLQFRSRFKTDPKGTDDSLRKGPNKELLTNDILASCKGPNTEMCKGRNSDLLIVSQPPTGEEIQPILEKFFKAKEAENQVKPCGPAQDRRKGAQRSLAHGSTYKFP